MALGWAIMGTGRFAANRIAPALNRAHNCKAIAVISRDHDRGEAFAAEFGLARAYDDFDAAMADPRIEAVWIAIPHALHHPAVLAAARAGRHVLCEKPLATEPADAREMVRACRQAGVALGTGFHLRHHPLHLEMRRLVLAGDTGPVMAADAEWSVSAQDDVGAAEWLWDPGISGGGIFTGTGVHALDLLRFVLNDDVERVTAVADPAASTGKVERRLLATLAFSRGAIATVRAMRDVHAPANDLILEGRNAFLRARHTLDEPARGVLEAAGIDVRLTGVPVGTDLYALQAESFAGAVSAGNDPSASGLDGQRVCEITAAIYSAAATGRAVQVTKAG